jgi:Coenzyme PQQ synthesis protein D (PqqD)
MKLARYTKFREEKFGGVLFDTRSEKVFSLNPTAAAVVREIRAGGDERGIVDRLQARFHATDGSIERDAASFISSLRQQGLLED